MLTSVASLVSVTLTPASTAPLESATRPRMRPPVPCADVIVEQISNKLRIELKEISEQNFRDALDNSFDDGMEGILQI
jgi:hypothetical protein